MSKTKAVAVVLWIALAQAAVAQESQPNAVEPAQAPPLRQVPVTDPTPGAEATSPDPDTVAPPPPVDGSPPGRLKAGASQNAFELGTQERMLAWEKWHASVGRALGKRIGEANGASIGTTILRITISKDGVLKAQQIAGNDRMGKVAVEAAESLSFDRILKFPPESKRDVMMFDFQYKRGFFILPKHHYIKDDYERMDEGPAR